VASFPRLTKDLLTDWWKLASSRRKDFLITSAILCYFPSIGKKWDPLFLLWACWRLEDTGWMDEGEALFMRWALYGGINK